MFWSDQPIIKENVDDEKEIKEKTPPAKPLGPDFKFISTEGLRNFIKEFYGESITVILDKKLFSWLLQKNPILLLLAKEEQPVGSIMSIVFDLTINKKRIRSAYTSFLAVHKENRKEGLAAHLISYVIEKNYPVIVGYYFSPNKIGANAIPINIWLRPLNYNLCFDLNLFSQNKDKFQELYQIKKVETKFNATNPDKLILFNKNYKIRLSTNEFLNYLKMPNLVLLEVKGLGFACFRVEKQWIPEKRKKINIIWLYLVWAKDNLKITNALIYYLSLKYKNCPYMLIPEMAFADVNFLTAVNSIQISQKWLCWYNWTGNYKKEDIFLPIF